MHKLSKLFVWGAGVFLVVGIVTVLLLPRPNRKVEVGQSYPIQGQDHIEVGASHASYNSNPPTSGPHYVQAASWGVHDTELPDEQLVHNLEHGGIWIAYKNIDEVTKVALEKITSSQSKIIMTPRAKDDAPIVLASWGRLQTLQSYDEKAILAFIEANKNQSPEPMAQ